MHTHAPEKWDTEGLPYGAECKCSECGHEGSSTYHFDFYAYNAGDPLICQTCIVMDELTAYIRPEIGGRDNRSLRYSIDHQAPGKAEVIRLDAIKRRDERRAEGVEHPLTDGN